MDYADAAREPVFMTKQRGCVRDLGSSRDDLDGGADLRVYERRGLMEPARTPGGTRLYSHDDLDRLIRIRDLLTAGLNLAGIAQVLELETEIGRLKAANVRIRRALSVREAG